MQYIIKYFFPNALHKYPASYSSVQPTRRSDPQGTPGPPSPPALLFNRRPPGVTVAEWLARSGDRSSSEVICWR